MSDDYGGDGRGQSDGGASMANVVYILYLVSLFTGLTGLIGLIMAYVNYGNSEPWVKTHYQFQIRTFWIGLLISVVGVITTLILIGWLVLLFGLIWLIMRCTKGMSLLGRREPVPNPETWLWD
jgi:uncharacterized membrane protein